MTLIREADHGTPDTGADAQVTLTIDGASVTVPAGTSIMRAASLVGNQIPKLCATDSMKAFGSCRICLVEIDGRPGTPASCTTPVADGMAVVTQSERLQRLRKGVMELYLSDHPAPAEATEMQEMAAMVGAARDRYLPVAQHLGAPCDTSNP
jgi:formate dehydrogenase major subunit